MHGIEPHLLELMQLHQTHFMPRKFSRAARAAKLRGARSCFCVDVRPSVLRSTAEVCAVFECASRCEQMLLHTYWYYLRASIWRVGPAAEHVHGRAALRHLLAPPSWPYSDGGSTLASAHESATAGREGAPPPASTATTIMEMACDRTGSMFSRLSSLVTPL